MVRERASLGAERSRGNGARDGGQKWSALGSDGPFERPWKRRLRLLHERTKREGRTTLRKPARGAPLPLEIAPAAGAGRRSGRAGLVGTGRRLFCQPGTRLPAWSLGF